MEKIKVGIIGATGFTGSELVRILVHHPDVSIRFITSESHSGKLFSDIHPVFQGIADIGLVSIDSVRPDDVDVLFLALPHGVSMDYIKRMKDARCRIIDLSGDYRLDTAEDYEEWYGKKHVYPEAFSRSAYGIPELNAAEIREASIIANPGCYPTSAILGLAPLVEQGIVKSDSVIVDSKSGVTGAGVKPKNVNMYSSVNENFKAYGLKKHRHSIEIQQRLQHKTESNVRIQFTPHLLPIDRGIISTMYAPMISYKDDKMLNRLYQDYYGAAPFIRLRKNTPSVKDVRGSNYCDIHVTSDERTGNVIVISAIDNLVKGAAGQAVQNMNLVFDLDQATGLKHVPLNP